ncbi:MAG: CHAT domain-containing protein [Methyloligellaceae bacterium]
MLRFSLISLTAFLLSNSQLFASQHSFQHKDISPGTEVISGFKVQPGLVVSPQRQRVLQLAQRSRANCIARRKAQGKKITEYGIKKCMQSGGSNSNKAYGNKKKTRKPKRESVGLESQDVEEVVDLDLGESESVSSDLLTFTSENAPKSIGDITAILDQQKPDPKRVAKRKSIASLSPPDTENKKKLVKFYLNRGKAASRVGKTLQQIEDFKKAEQISRTAKSLKLRIEALKRLSGAQFLAGNWGASIKIRQKILKIFERKKIGRNAVRWRAILVSDYARMGKFAAAEKQMRLIEQRLKNFPKKANWQRDKQKIQAMASRAKANLLDSQRKFQKAESLYKSSLSFLQAATSGKESLILRDSIKAELANNLMYQGRWIEAEIQAREALINSLSRAGKYSTETTANLLLLANVIGGQGRFKDAIILSEVAVEILKSLGLGNDALPLNRAQKILAIAYFNSGDIEKSLKIFDEIEIAIGSRKKRFDAILVRDITWHLAMLLGDRHEKALPLLKRAVELRRKGRKGGVAFLKSALATALWKNGQSDPALKHFKTAIPHILKISTGDDEEFTQGTLIERRKSIVLSFYLEYLADIEGTPFAAKNKIKARARSFELADIIRGQSVQRALSASSARRSVKDPKLAKLLRAEQDVRKLLSARNALLTSLLSQPPDQRDKAAIKQLRQDINKSKGARDRLQAELNTRFPDFAELMNPKAPTIKDVQRGLNVNESLISIYVGRKKTYIWAVPKEGDSHFAVADVGQDRLSKTVAALREALDPRAQTLGDIPDFDLRLAYRLYKQILEPVEGGWKNSNSLLIATNGALGEIPFSILPTKRVRKSKTEGPLFADYRDVPWLVRTHAITLVPSAASLLTLRSLPPSKAGRNPFIGFGDPFFNQKQSKRSKVADKGGSTEISSRSLNVRGLPVALRAAPSTGNASEVNLSDLPRLPDTADEVRQLAVAMNANLTKSVFLGKQANEGFIKSKELSGFRVLAFATHGLVPGELSGLNEPALALSAPEVAGNQGDGLLTMSEILGLKLDADWVILSACNTGSSRGNGAEAVSGLGRAFFYAGTRALLVSSWPVETNSARILTTDIFARQKTDQKLHRSEALRRAMVALIDGTGHRDPGTGEVLYTHAHPIFWAPFILVGDGA